MRQIPRSFGLIYFLEDLEATEAALAADPDAKELADAFTDAITEWDEIFKKQREGRRKVVRAEAVVSVKNARLDMTTMRFAKMVSAVAADMLAKLFRLAPGRFIRRNLRKQCEDTQHIILPEIHKLEKKHALKPFEAELTKGAEEAIASLDERSRAKAARQVASNDVDEFKEGVNALRTTTFAELLKMATEKGYPRAWVDSFFRTDSASDDDGEDAAEPNEPKGDAKGTPE